MPYVASIGTYLPCRGTPEVHDFFTGADLISYEDLGFAEVKTIGGGSPVNIAGVTILEGPVTHGG